MRKEAQHTSKKLVDHLFREEAGKMTAILIRLFGFRNAELAEDIVQETFLSAMRNWPLKQIPDDPSAWLMQVAKNKAINVVRREQRIRDKNRDFEHEQWLAEERIEQLFLDHEIKDSQLKILFTCCYPEIKQREQVMLILNILGGFNNKEIANALLMSTSAVKKALYRAKNIIKDHYQSLPVIDKYQAEERRDTVLKAVYLIFNEGYSTSFSESALDKDLCYVAIRLAHLLLKLEGQSVGKTNALLSLMYFHAARFPARIDAEKGLVDLKDQDRGKWDKDLINKGFYHLKRSRLGDEVSSFHFESAIASVHCSAQTFEETNWELVARYYQKLTKTNSSPLVALNYAISISYRKGPEAGIKKLDEIEVTLPQQKQYLLFAARAEMNVRLNNYELAKSYYQVAYDQARSTAVQTYIQGKIEECNRLSLSKN